MARTGSLSFCASGALSFYWQKSFANLEFKKAVIFEQPQVVNMENNVFAIRNSSAAAQNDFPGMYVEIKTININ